MPPVCSAIHCMNSYRTGYTLVRFPKDAQWKEAWVKAIWRGELRVPSPSARICEIHFQLGDWLDYKRILKPDAVPSLFCSCPSFRNHSATCIVTISENVRKAVPNITQTPALKSSLKAEKENLLLQADILQLKREVAVTARAINNKDKEINVLKMGSEVADNWWRSKFSDDQVRAAQSPTSSKGVTWELSTVEKGLRLRYSCGSGGLGVVSDEVFPLPSVRTLQRRTQCIRFLPGLLHEFLEPFAEVVPTFGEDDRDCSIHFDDMSIKCQRCYDKGTNSYTGGVSFEGVDGLASKMEVWTMAGIRAKWKLNAAYHFTPATNSIVKEAKASLLKDLLHYTERVGLNCTALVCDMGNRDVLLELGFNTRKNTRKFAILNPANPEKTLYLVPDIVHVFKSAKEMLVNNQEIQLSAEIVERFQLPSDIVKLQHIEWLVDYQKDMSVKFAPRLTMKDLSHNHFSKMNTGSACHVFSDKCSAAISFLADNNVFERESHTTAFFVDLMNKWFTILSCRDMIHALSLRNMEKYEEAIGLLRLTIDVFLGLNVNSVWKPVQTHLVMATEALLEIQEVLLYEKQYDFIMLGRFTNDISENLFSDVRRQRPVPTAVEAKYRLKQVTLSQCARKVTKSQYEHDERRSLLNLEDIINYIERKQSSVPSATVSDFVLPWQSPSAENYKHQNQVLYRMMGYVLHSMRQANTLKCDDCFVQLQHIGDAPLPMASWTMKTDFIPGAQIQVCDQLYKLLYAIDYNMKCWFNQLVKLPDNKRLVLNSIAEPVMEYALPICPSCTSLKEHICSRFVEMRLKQLPLTELDKNQASNNQGHYFSSKSMGSRLLASKYINKKRKSKESVMTNKTDTAVAKKRKSKETDTAVAKKRKSEESVITNKTDTAVAKKTAPKKSTGMKRLKTLP